MNHHVTFWHSRGNFKLILLFEILILCLFNNWVLTRSVLCQKYFFIEIAITVVEFHWTNFCVYLIIISSDWGFLWNIFAVEAVWWGYLIIPFFVLTTFYTNFIEKLLRLSILCINWIFNRESLLNSTCCPISFVLVV